MKLQDILTIRNSIIAIVIGGIITHFLLNKNSANSSIDIEDSNNVSIDNSQKNYNNSTVIEKQTINNRDKETEKNNRYLKEDVSNFINSYNDLIDDFLKEEDLTNALKITKKAIEPIKKGKFEDGIKILNDEEIEKEVKILDKLLYEFELLNKDKEKLVNKFETINELRKKNINFTL